MYDFIVGSRQCIIPSTPSTQQTVGVFVPITTDLKMGNLDMKDATNQMGYITVIVWLLRKLCHEQSSPLHFALVLRTVHGIISEATIL